MNMTISVIEDERVFTDEEKRFRIIEGKDKKYHLYLSEDGEFLKETKSFPTFKECLKYVKENCYE